MYKILSMCACFTRYAVCRNKGSHLIREKVSLYFFLEMWNGFY